MVRCVKKRVRIPVDDGTPDKCIDHIKDWINHPEKCPLECNCRFRGINNEVDSNVEWRYMVVEKIHQSIRDTNGWSIQKKVEDDASDQEISRSRTSKTLEICNRTPSNSPISQQSKDDPRKQVTFIGKVAK